MTAGKSGIGLRILLPIFVLVVGLTVGLLVLVARISNKVRADYHRFTVTESADRVAAALQLATSELTAARLLDNPVVAGAKQHSVRETIANHWAHAGLGGVIFADGAVVLSTLTPADTASVLAHGGPDYFTLSGENGRLFCQRTVFPVWEWTVITVAHDTDPSMVRRELAWLLPLMGLGATGLIGGLFVVLWWNLRRPVAAMVSAAQAEREIPKTGVAEFDRIGSAVNDALARAHKGEKHIRLLLDSTAEGIFGVDLSGVCTFCNPACLALLGLSREEEMLGKKVHQISHHSRSDGVPYSEQDCRIFEAFRKETGVHVDDEVFWRADGTSFPVEYRSYPVVEEGRGVTGAVVVFSDVTERRRSEQFIKNILQTVDEGFMVVDRSHKILLANRALGVLVGAPPAEVVGRSCHELFHDLPHPCDDTRWKCLLHEVFTAGKSTSDEHTHRRSDGSEIKIEIHAYPVTDTGGKIATAILTLTNITEKTGLEQQLRQAQKMEAVGRLAGGIAHDFNNMLMAIVGYASLGRELAEEGSKQRHYNDQVLAAADKAADLTRQILAFSRKQVMQVVPVDVNAVILGMGRIITRLLGEDIQVSLHLSGSALVALADRAQIEQVLMNLCTNARDAMPSGGRLTIGTQAVVCDAETAARHGLEAQGSYALIALSDTGTGMDDKTRQRIFEPFFTTKELGKGTGLGLSIVYGIVKQHHGQVSVYSEPGRGTTFRIYLPLTSEKVAEDPAAAAPAAVRGGTETVLLAEDDENVRALAQSVLEGAGYRVILAEDGVDAVRLFAGHPDEVGLCLFDVVMPRKSGREALEEIRALRPGLRAIFMSGYAGEILDQQKSGETAFTYLAKPLLPRELLRKVRETLDA